MSLSKVSVPTIIGRQFLYKCKAYISIYSSLVVIQLLAILFSLGGTGMMGTTIGYNNVEFQFYSADVVIVFTMIWGFIVSIQLTTKGFRESDFSFVTNRLTSNLANIIFLLTASVIGAITAILSGYLLRVIMFIFFDYEFLGAELGYDVGVLIGGLITTILYILMFSAMGYVMGMLVQINKSFIVILPVSIIGALFVIGRINNEILMDIGQFYFTESSFLLAFIKIIVTAGICFLLSVLISNRLEVRK